MAKLISESITVSVSKMIKGSADSDADLDMMLHNDLLDQLETILAELLEANGTTGSLVEIVRK